MKTRVKLVCVILLSLLIVNITTATTETLGINTAISLLIPAVIIILLDENE